jgi:hypothetical protein
MDYDLTPDEIKQCGLDLPEIGQRAVKKYQEWLAKPFEKPCPCRTYDRQVCDSPADRLAKACPDYALWFGYTKGLQERKKLGKRAWYILDEIAVRHSAQHRGKGLCPICDRVEEAMRLLHKPSPDECKQLFQERGKHESM